jgi:hypothetical protein
MAKKRSLLTGLSKALGLSSKPKAKTRSKALASVSYSALRRANPAENVRMGFSPTARRYVKAAAKVTKRTASISARAAETKRTRERYGYATPEAATKARGRGELSYESQTQARRVAKARKTRRLRERIDAKTRRIAAKNGFPTGPNQTNEVLAFLKKQSAKHDRYLAGNERSRLDEDEYRRTVSLAYRYLGKDDERLRDMLMSPDMIGIAA